MEVEDIFGPITGELKLVERELISQIKVIMDGQNSQNSQADYIRKTVNHLFTTPGKRLRPALVILSAKSVADEYSPTNGSLIKLATAAELIHSASLIHDDIIDDEKIRRQQISLNEKYGNQIAVLVGDILYTQSFSLLTDLRPIPDKQKVKLLQLFCKTTQRMCLGEINERRIIINKINPSMQEYIEIIEYKTATLMSACCKSSAIQYGVDDATSEALANFGRNFGLAYQLIDDHIDKDAVFSTGLNMLESAKEYLSHAKESIKPLEKSESKKTLFDLCDFILDRAHD